MMGRDLGDVTELQARRIEEAARGMNTDALYLNGLLWLYGKGVEKRDARRAAKIFREAAELGHASSQTALGVLLRHGFGSPRDDYASFAWLSTGAKNGDLEAAWLLGVAYLEANNYTHARRWLRKAVEDGDSLDGMHWLGVMDEYGLGINGANYSSAASWYARACCTRKDQHHSDAAYKLGLMHAYGRGFNQDFGRALNLFQQAAIEGHAGAMYYIGVIHLYGHGGVPINYDVARAWFRKAELSSQGKGFYAEKAESARRELESSVAVAADARQRVLDTYS